MQTTKALPFVETFEFVEPHRAGKNAVPNHILESKIYAKVQQNAAVKASPAVVHFEGLSVGQTQTFVVSLCNVARDVVRMHVIPPQSKYFKIRYTKGERLVPGMTMNCIIEFTPDEYRYYYDAIRIHSPGEDNVIIPIHAFPVMDAGDFPTQLKFPQTALGQRKSHVITLRCHVPVDFEFELEKLQADDAYSVTPMSGVVPASGMTDITITYEPISYSTSIMMLQLKVSQFNAKPMLCNVTGYCQPGSKAMKMKSEVTLDLGSQRVCSPLERSRQKKVQMATKKPATTKSEKARRQSKKVIEKDGLRFPEQLNTVHHVANVLLQTPGKMQLKELIEAEKSVSGRQMKENKFDQAIRKNVYEERQNQLRWQVKLGESAMPQHEKVRVQAERDYAWQLYKDFRGDPKPDEEKERTEIEHIWRRTIRNAEDFAMEGIQFDLYTNSPWATRHSATDRFAQAARKIILRNRAKKNLSQLKSFLVSWNKKQEEGGADDAQSGKRKKLVPVIEPDEVGGDQHQQKLQPILIAERVIPSKYPFFVPPNKKDDMAPDALAEVINFESRVDIASKTPYFDLQVPQQHKLLGYSDHEIHQGYDYVAPSLARSLRAGAKEEIVNMKKPYESSQLEKKEVHSTGELKIQDLEKHEEETASSNLVQLDAPEAMFKPIEYPPLHIFNATPGLQVFQTPVPYAEIDADYHLCPLPKYIVRPGDANQHNQTQKQYLDREDVIKGTMAWKKFPSQGLTSLANTPTLTNVWVPRWSDPFSGDILDHEVPSLQSGLAQADVLEHENDFTEGEEEENSIQLTPAMVSAQFGELPSKHITEEKTPAGDSFPYGNKMPSTNIPVSTNGPVPREKREQELDYFLSRKSNRLGQKIQTKVDHLNSVTFRSDLVFK